MRSPTKKELSLIFPQHNEETILSIYDNVIESLGEDAYAFILPTCIEKLLELADTKQATNGTVGLRETPSGQKRNKCSAKLFKSKPSKNGLDANDIKLCYNVKDERDSDKFSSHRKSDSISLSSDENESSTTRTRHINGEMKNDDTSERSFVLRSLRNKRKSDESVDSCIAKKSKTTKRSPVTPSVLRSIRKRTISLSGSDDESGSDDDESGSDDDESGSVDELNSSSTKHLVPSQLTKGMDDFLEISKKKIKDIINDVDKSYLEYLINKQEDSLPVSDIVNIVVEYLLEHGDYVKADTSNAGPSKSTVTSQKFTSQKYEKQSVSLLQNKFPKVPTNVIRQIFVKEKTYTKSFVQLENILEKISSGQKKVADTIINSFLRGKREKIEVTDLCCVLSDEVEHLEKTEKTEKNENEVENVGQSDGGHSVECGCCYNEVVFEEMVQCVDGHLFCVTCLQNYSKEAIYGSTKVQLYCMSEGCESSFPRSQLKKALTDDMLNKYMERVQNEDLKLANIENLVTCPHCEFAVDMDEGLRVFRCQNPSCLKETCRHCKEEWKDHAGLKCKEVEKKEATNLRTSYEEKMTEAKARKCFQCSTLFVKFDGCNKMTCRCGAKMCYICRKGLIDYEHFCQHPRTPGKGCTTCKKCCLWTDPSEDDDRAVAEIKEKAEKENAKLTGFSIGPAASSSGSSKNTKSTNDAKPQGYFEYYGSSDDDDSDDTEFGDDDDDDNDSDRGRGCRSGCGCCESDDCHSDNSSSLGNSDDDDDDQW